MRRSHVLPGESCSFVWGIELTARLWLYPAVKFVSHDNLSSFVVVVRS